MPNVEFGSNLRGFGQIWVGIDLKSVWVRYDGCGQIWVDINKVARFGIQSRLGEYIYNSKLLWLVWIMEDEVVIWLYDPINKRNKKNNF